MFSEEELSSAQSAGDDIREVLARVARKHEVDPKSVGTIPLKMLKAAARGCHVGVCRNVNVAFAGLLLELGYPPSEVRLGFGSIDHVWVEVRDPRTNKWIDMDATPLTPYQRAQRKLSREIYLLQRAMLGKFAPKPPAILQPRSNNVDLFPFVRYSNETDLLEPPSEEAANEFDRLVNEMRRFAKERKGGRGERDE